MTARLSVVGRTELAMLESTLRALYQTFIQTADQMDNGALQNFARDCNLIDGPGGKLREPP